MARGYSLDGMANVIYPSFQAGLTVNLNTLVGRDSEGKYMQPSTANATVANNYPIQEAGMLEVLRHAANGIDNVMQRYTGFSSRRIFIRSQIDTSGTWSDWDELILASQVYKALYPVGTVLMFEAAVNPNSLFPGTTWAQRISGRSIRGATSNVVGTTAGQIGSLVGADSVTLVPAQVPQHVHSIAHTHNIQHQHSVPSHVHGMEHTHQVPAHAHAMPHTHQVPAHGHTASASTSVTVASNGGHNHGSGLNLPGNQDGLAGYGVKAIPGNAVAAAVSRGGSAANIQAITETAGAHAHSASASTSVTVDNAAAFNTGGVSTPNTSASAAFNTGGVSTANTGGVTAFATTGGPTDTGGSSAANSGPGLGNASGGTNSIDVRNSSVYYAMWARIS